MRSPLVDLTAWHKKSALVIGPPHPSSVDCHRCVTAGQLCDVNTFELSK